jgi:hypothetical protein
MKTTAVVMMIAAGLAGCADPGRPPGSQTTDRGPSPSAAWTVDALDAQPRLAELRASTPAATGFAPASTLWMASEIAVPETLSASTPGALLAMITAAQGWTDSLGDAVWEQTTRVWTTDDDSSTGIVLLWGFMDDAVAGRDVRLTMRRRDGMWRVERIEERHHCRRGVTRESRCT